METIEEEYVLENGTRIQEIRYYKNGTLVHTERLIFPVVVLDHVTVVVEEVDYAYPTT